MTWQAHHDHSAELAGQAEIAMHRGDRDAAMAFYRQAAAAEAESLRSIDPSDSFLVGITAVSAAALHFKGGEGKIAGQIAHRYLAEDNLPESSRQRLDELLERIRTEKQWREARLDRDATLRFALDGGETMHGGAPADVLEAPRRAAVALVTRSIEFKLSADYRTGGKASPDALRQFRPWILQAPAGSYQFDVAVQPPEQRELMPAHEASAESVVQSAADILAAAAQTPDAGLREIVPDPDYRRAFLKIAKDLMPDDHGFRRLEVRAPSRDAPIVLRSISRDIVADAIKRLDADAEQDGEPRENIEIKGILRNVHLDSEWIEVRVDAVKHRISGFNEDLATRAGGLLNQKVILAVQRDQAGKLHFHDINADA